VVLDASFGKFDVSHSIMVAHQLTPSYWKIKNQGSSLGSSHYATPWTASHEYIFSHHQQSQHLVYLRVWGCD
jgi:hypothetical protein